MDATEGDQIPILFNGLIIAPKNVRLAARRVYQSSLRDDDDVVLDACIGIEALLGNERDELTHRMSLRAAVALATGGSKMPPKTTYSVMKKVYGHRSAIVHRSESKKGIIAIGGDDYRVSTVAVFMLRALMSNLLQLETPWMAGSLDDELISALPQHESDPAE